jgi:hypothetical protein
MDESQFPEPRVTEMIAGVAKYMRAERSRYLRASEPLASNLKTAVQHYFPKTLVERVKTVTLKGARIPEGVTTGVTKKRPRVSWKGGRNPGPWRGGRLKRLLKTEFYFEDCAASRQSLRNSS